MVMWCQVSSVSCVDTAQLWKSIGYASVQFLLCELCFHKYWLDGSNCFSVNSSSFHHWFSSFWWCSLYNIHLSCSNNRCWSTVRWFHCGLSTCCFQYSHHIIVSMAQLSSCVQFRCCSRLSSRIKKCSLRLQHSSVLPWRWVIHCSASYTVRMSQTLSSSFPVNLSCLLFWVAFPFAVSEICVSVLTLNQLQDLGGCSVGRRCEYVVYESGLAQRKRRYQGSSFCGIGVVFMCFWFTMPGAFGDGQSCLFDRVKYVCLISRDWRPCSVLLSIVYMYWRTCEYEEIFLHHVSKDHKINCRSFQFHASCPRLKKKYVVSASAEEHQSHMDDLLLLVMYGGCLILW